MDRLLPKNDTSRKIIHLDMDAFYASVEMRDDPKLVNKALIIGQDPRKSNGHGVVATANYIARKYGVHSAMSTAKALQLVPESEVVFLKPNFEKYRSVSNQIHKLMYEITDQVESVALDEAYLDVTKNKVGTYSALELAINLQKAIFKDIHLNSSFGISYNKFLAKMGSEYAKPFGRTIILPQEARQFLARRKISDFPGIGKKTQEQLKALGIHTGADLQQLDVDFLIKKFKKMGYMIAQHAQGIDLSPVTSNRKRKSIGIERTFEPNIYDQNQALTLLRTYSEQLAKKLAEKQVTAQTIVLKIRNNNFETITRRLKLRKPSRDALDFFQDAKTLFTPLEYFLKDGIRLLGLSVTDLIAKSFEEIKLDLFETK